MKVLIIGAGPAGISCAHELVKFGIEVEIFEQSGQVGGMCRSFELWDQKVDLGPHRFFSKEKNVNLFFHDILKDDFTSVNRLTRIYYRNRFFAYPLKLGNVFKNLGIFTIFRILWDYLMVRIRPIKNPDTFEKWIINRFGKKLFEIFFKSYSEKLWGISCSEIDSDWASQRIKSLSLIGAIVNAFKAKRSQKHTTLVDQFNYPKGGTGVLYERCAEKLIEDGCKINFSSAIHQVLVNESGKVWGIKLADGREVIGDIVVSTMPLTHLIKGLKGLSVPETVTKATNKLRFRNTILVYLEVDDIDLFQDNWIYVHSDEVKHGRITNFRNWCPSLTNNKETSILCLEFWAFESDEIWSYNDEKLQELAAREIKALHLFEGSTQIINSHVVKVPKCYPVYQKGYQENLDVIINYLAKVESLIPIGRYGAFKYNNQDHSILMGILAARNISGAGNSNLWKINTDTEYQEDGNIRDVLIQ